MTGSFFGIITIVVLAISYNFANGDTTNPEGLNITSIMTVSVNESWTGPGSSHAVTVYPDNAIVFITLEYSNVAIDMSVAEQKNNSDQNVISTYHLPSGTISMELPPRVAPFTLNITGTGQNGQQCFYNLTLFGKSLPSDPITVELNGTGKFLDITKTASNDSYAFSSNNDRLAAFFACDASETQPYASQAQECDNILFYKNRAATTFIGYGNYMVGANNGKIPLVDADTRLMIMHYYKEKLYAQSYICLIKNDSSNFDKYTAKSSEVQSSLDAGGSFAAEVRFSKVNPKSMKYFKSMVLTGNNPKFYIYENVPEIPDFNNMPSDNIILTVDGQNSSSIVNYNLTAPIYTFVIVGGAANFEISDYYEPLITTTPSPNEDGSTTTKPLIITTPSPNEGGSTTTKHSYLTAHQSISFIFIVSLIMNSLLFVTL